MFYNVVFLMIFLLTQWEFEVLLNKDTIFIFRNLTNLIHLFALYFLQIYVKQIFPL